MGKGVGRVWRPPAPRVERARPTDPSSTSFDRSGPDKGPSTVQKWFSMMARAVEGAPDCAPHPATRHIISKHKSRLKSSQVKSSQVVQIQNGGRQSASFGAHRWRERPGGQISAQPAPLDSPESGHHPHLLVLDRRGAPGLQLRAFFRKSTVRQCNTAPGRRRERSGARARAVPMGQGVGRVWRPPAPRVERARPFSDEFWCFGPDKGTSIILVARQDTRAAGAAAAKRSRTCSPSARHTPPTHHISRMRVRATHRCLQPAMGAAAELSCSKTRWAWA